MANGQKEKEEGGANIGNRRNITLFDDRLKVMEMDKQSKTFIHYIVDHLRVITQPTSSRSFFSFYAYSRFMFFFSIEGTLSAKSLASLRPKLKISLRALMTLIFWATSTVVSSTS